MGNNAFVMLEILCVSGLVAIIIGFISGDGSYTGAGVLLLLAALLSGSVCELFKTLLVAATIMTPIGLIVGWRN